MLFLFFLWKCKGIYIISMNDYVDIENEKQFLMYSC